MPEQIRNVFISHIHEDDGGIDQVKNLAGRHGMIVRNGSVTSDRPNSAKAENYIKYQILAPRIDWASVLVVYVCISGDKTQLVGELGDRVRA